MNRFVLSIAAFFIATTSNGFAWSGGPWTNGNPIAGGYNGTYKASVVGPNTIGVLVFANDGTAGTGTSTASPTSASGLGTAVMFVRGIAYTGTVVGMVEPVDRTVAGVFSGTSSTEDEDTDATESVFTAIVTPGSTAGVSANATQPFHQQGTMRGGFVGEVRNRGGAAVTFTGRGRISVVEETVTETGTVNETGSSSTTVPAPAGGNTSSNVDNGSATVNQTVTQRSYPITVKGSRTSFLTKPAP